MHREPVLVSSSRLWPVFRPCRAAALVALTALASGCAVVNPYVSCQKSTSRNGCSELPEYEFAGDLDAAIRDADAWRATYYEAAGDYARFRSASAALILPLSAAAIFDGIAGLGGKGEIARLSLGAATAYGAQSYFASAPRQKVYFAGARAISCAMLAVRPLARQQKWLTGLEDLLDKQSASMGALQRSLANFKFVVAVADAQAGVSKKEVRERIRSAEDALSAASAIHANGNTVAHNIETSGFLLAATVRRIADDVSLLLTKSEQDPQSLLSIASGLAVVGKTFSGGYLTVPEPAGVVAGTEEENTSGEKGFKKAPKKGSSPVEVARSKLIDAQSALAKDSAELEAYLSADLPAVPVDAVDACGVDEATASIGLSVVPAGASFTLTNGHSITLHVSGGSGVPDYRMAGVDVDAFSLVRDPQSKSMTLSVKATRATSDAGAVLLLVDGSGSYTKEIKLFATP